MAFFQLQQEQKIPASLDVVWDFIRSPKNLKEITPDYMGFDITTPDLPNEMYPGMIISYQVRPLLNIPTTWVTEITQVRDKQFFIDEQRVGPYKLWHHQHFVEEVPGGVLMKDIVTYEPPFGMIGALANKFLIRNKLNEIFEYRRKAVIEKFGEWSPNNASQA